MTVRIASRNRRAGALVGLFACGCLVAGGHALPLAVPKLREHGDLLRSARAGLRGARLVREARIVLQQRASDCGAACLKMILTDHGIERSLSDLARAAETTADGASLRDLRMVAEGEGLRARSWVIRGDDLLRVPLPAIAFINGNHFVVVRRVVGRGLLEVDDPALGRLWWPFQCFRKAWSGQLLVFDPSWTPP